MIGIIFLQAFEALHYKVFTHQYFYISIVAMHREKEELVDGPYRRDFLTYDNHVLDGEIFLQVRTFDYQLCLIKIVPLSSRINQ